MKFSNYWPTTSTILFRGSHHSHDFAVKIQLNDWIRITCFYILVPTCIFCAHIFSKQIYTGGLWDIFCAHIILFSEHSTVDETFVCNVLWKNYTRYTIILHREFCRSHSLKKVSILLFPKMQLIPALLLCKHYHQGICFAPPF